MLPPGPGVMATAAVQNQTSRFPPAVHGRARFISALPQIDRQTIRADIYSKPPTRLNPVPINPGRRFHGGFWACGVDGVRPPAG